MQRTCSLLPRTGNPGDSARSWLCPAKVFLSVLVGFWNRTRLLWGEDGGDLSVWAFRMVSCVLMKESYLIIWGTDRIFQVNPDFQSITFSCSHHLSAVDTIWGELASVMTPASRHWLHGGKCNLWSTGKTPPLCCVFHQHVDIRSALLKGARARSAAQALRVQKQLSDPELGAVVPLVPARLQCGEIRPWS